LKYKSDSNQAAWNADRKERQKRPEWPSAVIRSGFEDWPLAGRRLWREHALKLPFTGRA
jgi:hypothetical protein